MSITYYGFSKLPAVEAQRRIAHIRKTRPQWFDVTLLLYDAHPPQKPFGHEIAAQFLAGTQSTFALAINDKERFSDILRDALEFIYVVFGTDDLVITHEMELVHPPIAPHPGLKI
jgi:hypothetical protein